MSYKRVITKKNILGGVILAALGVGLLYGFINYLSQEGKEVVYGILLVGLVVALAIAGFEFVTDSKYEYVEDPPKKKYKYLANTVINRKLHPKGEVVLRVEE